MKYRTFGKRAAACPVLGFGTMRMPTADGQEMSSAPDEEACVRLIRGAIDRGVNYIDTAYLYHGGNAEHIVAKALADGYRDKVYLADKGPIWLLDTAEDFDRILDEQLAKCATDHFDFYLLHSVSANTFESKIKGLGLLERMRAARDDGRIRHIGFSFHDRFSVFQEVLDYTDLWSSARSSSTMPARITRPARAGLRLRGARPGRGGDGAAAGRKAGPAGTENGGVPLRRKGRRCSGRWTGCGISRR